MYFVDVKFVPLEHLQDQYEEGTRAATLGAAYYDFHEPDEDNILAEYCLMQKNNKALCAALEASIPDLLCTFPDLTIPTGGVFPTSLVEKCDGLKSKLSKPRDCDPKKAVGIPAPGDCDLMTCRRNHQDPDSYERTIHTSLFEPKANNPPKYLGAKCRECRKDPSTDLPIPWEGPNKPGDKKPVWVCKHVATYVFTNCYDEGFLCDKHYLELSANYSPDRTKGGRKRRTAACAANQQILWSDE